MKMLKNLLALRTAALASRAWKRCLAWIQFTMELEERSLHLTQRGGGKTDINVYIYSIDQETNPHRLVLTFLFTPSAQVKM